MFTLAKIAAFSSANTPAAESITPTNFSNAQRDEHKVKAAKNALLLHQHLRSNFIEYFSLQFLRRAPYSGATLPNAVATKSIKKYLRKSSSAFAPKKLVKLNPESDTYLDSLQNY